MREKISCIAFEAAFTNMNKQAKDCLISLFHQDPNKREICGD
jgi:hypothetical protein